MAKDFDELSGPCCVALTQVHRGHGVSTAAYYLSRVLVAQGLRVLLVDLTGRRARLGALVAHGPVKNLVFWAPNMARSQDVPLALERARHETAGKADVILLDIDDALLDRVGGFALGVDYVVAVTEHTAAGQTAAERLAERLHDDPAPHGRVGVVFSRVDAPTATELPQRTERRELPVIGYYPADYLLAAGDAYSLKGGDTANPHDTYLYALLRLGQRLAAIVPLRRVTAGPLGLGAQLPPVHETNGHPSV